MRRRAAQLAVAHARQPLRAVVSIIHRAKRVVLRRRNRDAGDQAVRIVGKLRHAAHRVGDLVQPAFCFVAGDVGIRGSVAAGVLRRFQPCQPRLQDLERHHVVGLVRDRDLHRRSVDPQLQLHALGVLEGAASAGVLEEVLGAVAVLPDVVVRVVQRQRRDLLVRVGLPAVAAAIVVVPAAAAVVVVIDGHRIAVAGHDGIGVFQHQVAVEQVGIRRARAARAHLLVLPPALDARMRDVVDVHHRAVGGVGRVGGIQLRVIVAGDVRWGAEGDAVVVADAALVAGTPLAVQVRQVEVEPGVARALHALERIGGDVRRVVRAEVQPVDRAGLPGLEHLVGADVLRGIRGLRGDLQHRADDGVAGPRNRERVELQQAHAAN